MDVLIPTVVVAVLAVLGLIVVAAFRGAELRDDWADRDPDDHPSPLNRTHPDDTEFPRETLIELPRGWAAWDPTSTKRDVVGPCHVQYLEYADGGFHVRVY